MLEQEIASAIKFILDSAGGPAPYYYEVPQDFLVPAVYFPKPEVMSGGDTLLTYALTYSWYIKFFHKDEPLAYELGFAALTALQYKKNVVPLIDETGALTGRGFRLKDPALKMLDRAAQLTLVWDSPRPYYDEKYEKMQHYYADLHTKSAYEAALLQINESEG